MNPIFLEITSGSGFAGLVSTFLPFLLVIVVMYFMLVAPQKKQEKKLQEMRAELQVGDGVTTVGGIVGRVVSLKDDTVLVETGSERTRIRFKRVAIQSVEKLDVEAN